MAKWRRVVIENTRSLTNSTSGNPRWAVYLSDGTELLTMSDVSCNYGINDMLNQPVEIELSTAGRIRNIRKAHQ